jgi:hypothetical protein
MDASPPHVRNRMESLLDVRKDLKPADDAEDRVIEEVRG